MSILKVITGILLLFSSVFLSAQEDIISSKNLHKDFKEFKKLIEIHPDPFTNTSEEEFNKQLDSIEESLEESMPLLDIYKKLSAQVALINDGHSAVYLPEKWMENQRKEYGAFPLDVHLTNENELYVLKDYNDKAVAKGVKITKINGISVDSFINYIDPYISYELKHFRNTKIERDFEMYLYLAFGKSQNTLIHYFTNQDEQVVLSNIPLKKWKKLKKENRTIREQKIAKGKPYDFQDLGNGIGHLSIFSFSVSNYASYRQFLIRTFKEIEEKEIHSLIIDVRGNFGGWPKVSSYLLHYLTENYFKTMAKSSFKISEPVKNNFRSMIRKYNNGRNMLFSKTLHYIDINEAIHGKVNTYINEESFFNERPIPKNYEFTGDIYLLTNRDSYSAASSFAATVQCYQLGSIIGEETGGTRIFRANAVMNQLSKTGIRVRFSTTIEYCTCYDQEMQGVTPNVEFRPSILDIVNGFDSQLNFTQRIIRKVRRN